MTGRFEPVDTRDRDGREQHLYRLGNDYGASVNRCDGAPGSDLVWFDVAVIRWIGGTFLIDFTTPITAGVLDALSADEVQDTLAQINALPLLAACRFDDCPVIAAPADLSTHERAEHSRCHQCGQDPHGTAPVAHLTVCQRYTQTGGRL